jgi:hypothetical protein
VASVGGALVLMMARPSGLAITVLLPLSTIIAPLCFVAAPARVTRSPEDSCQDSRP